MNKRITLKQIAEEFNVSIATVSKALKDSHDIGLNTRIKIQEYAEERGYKPNIFALGLKKSKTKTIGLILPNILNRYFAKVFSGVEKVANEYGYNVIISISHDSHQKELEATNYFLNGTVDGFIVSIAEETQKCQNYKHFTNTEKYGIGMVMMDRVCDEVQCDKVIVDDVEAAYKATNFFIKNNRKNIAIVSIISHTSVGKLRIEGYKNALVDNKIAIDDNLIVKVGKNDDLETLLKIVVGSRKVDAILCLEETATIDTLEFLKKQGHRIPEEISLIGFTNGELAQHATPRVTTVSQHGVFMGEQSMKFLLERLESMENETQLDPRIKTIKTSIIERDSTIKEA
ncbi:LacI family DNA-binding transcriptional regulator [Bacteroidota bacterium]